MRNAIPYNQPAGAAWAASNIESPFFYIPFPISVGSNLAATGIPVVSNIAGCPSTWSAIDANGTADNNEGFFSLDPTNDNVYLWPGNADCDGQTHPLFTLGHIFPAGTLNGVGGGIMLVAGAAYLPAAPAGYGAVVSFGNRSGSAGDGWSVGLGTGGVTLGIQNGGVVMTADTTNASVVYDNAVHWFALLIDAANGELLSVYDGTPVTPAGRATLLAAMDAMTLANLPVSWTVGALNSATVAGTRTPINSSAARLRELLVMNLTNYANAQADFYELADRLFRAPAYSLPHWMARF